MLCLPRVSCTTNPDGSAVSSAAPPLLRFSRGKEREEDEKRRRRRRQRQRRLVGCGLACRLGSGSRLLLVLGRSRREEGRSRPERSAGLYVPRWAGPDRVPAADQSISPRSPPRPLAYSLPLPPPPPPVSFAGSSSSARRQGAEGSSLSGLGGAAFLLLLLSTGTAGDPSALASISYSLAGSCGVLCCVSII